MSRWPARLAALAAGPASRPALSKAARLVTAEVPAIAGVWALGPTGDPRVGLDCHPADGTAAGVRDAILSELAGRRRGAFPVGRLRVRVLRERGQVLGGAVVHPGRAVLRRELAQLDDLLRLWFAREAARAEGAAQERGLALARALADGLLAEGESPLGLDQLFVKLRTIVPFDLLSLALPAGNAYLVVHVIPGSLDEALAEAMQAELVPALGGRAATWRVERVAARARGKRIGSAVVLPVPDLEGGEPGRLGLFALAPGAISGAQLGAVAQLMPGLARALSSARAVRALSAASRETSAELGRARQLQLAIAPGAHAVPGLDVAVGSRPVAGVSGDFHDLRAVDGRLAVLVADVAGHGVAAALEAAFLQGVLATERVPPAPAARLARLNAVLCGREALLATALAVEIEPGRLVHCAAGHAAPLIVRGGRAFEPVSREERECGNLLLGVTPEWRGRSGTTALAPGDLLVLYTDGIVEAAGPDGRFGLKRLTALCERLGGASAAEAVAAIEAAVSDYAPGDDRTVVVVRVT